MQLTRPTIPSFLLVAFLLFAGCSSEAPPLEEPHVFGNGARDLSRILARVNGYAITEAMLDLRLDELHHAERERFGTPEGRRLFLRRMVDEVLRVQDAEARRISRDPDVARVLISQRRSILTTAQQAELLKDKEPAIDDVRAYFSRHREQYKQLGGMRAYHVECLTREDAEEAYRTLIEKRDTFDRVVYQYSKNNETKLRGGALGWFNPGGYIGGIVNPVEFTKAVWELEDHINQPLEFEGRWHVVVIKERTPERLASLDEVYQRVLTDMRPEFDRAILEGWLQNARTVADIEYHGEYRPGQGSTAAELMERAFYVKDPARQIDLLMLIVDDYPDSEVADKALLFAANAAMDMRDDVSAHYYLSELLRRYPDSEVADDATYFLENMGRLGFTRPGSVEDLRPRR